MLVASEDVGAATSPTSTWRTHRSHAILRATGVKVTITWTRACEDARDRDQAPDRLHKRCQVILRSAVQRHPQQSSTSVNEVPLRVGTSRTDRMSGDEEACLINTEMTVLRVREMTTSATGRVRDDTNSLSVDAMTTKATAIDPQRATAETETKED